MIPLFILDIFLSFGSLMIPCFFLIGFYQEEKWNIPGLLAIFILYDIVYYQTYGWITGWLIVLFWLKKKWNQKKKKKIMFGVIWFLFFSGILLKNHLSLQLLWSKKVIGTFFFQFCFFCYLESKAKHKLYKQNIRNSDYEKKHDIIN